MSRRVTHVFSWLWNDIQHAIILLRTKPNHMQTRNDCTLDGMSLIKLVVSLHLNSMNPMRCRLLLPWCIIEYAHQHCSCKFSSHFRSIENNSSVFRWCLAQRWTNRVFSFYLALILFKRTCILYEGFNIWCGISSYKLKSTVALQQLDVVD
jgi:hypothetical protein